MLGKQLIFYDDVCATCHWFVRFLLNRSPDKRKRFRFLPISEFLSDSRFQNYRDQLDRAIDGESIVLLKNGVAYQKSEAIFSVLFALGMPWSILLLFRVIPRFIRDGIYDLIAKNRYRLFGKADAKALCEIPDIALRPLFLKSIPEETFLFPNREKVFLGAEWVNLVFLNYEIPKELLLPHVPEGTELDLWQGKALCSIVGFQMQQTMVLGRSIPYHEDFEELNLRFYVLRRVKTSEGEQIRRGVVFIKEIVPRLAIALVAQALYNENYIARHMGHHIHRSESQARFSYNWDLPGSRAELSAVFEGKPTEIEPKSLEEFITEHYWGYVKQRGGYTVEYEVEHPRWKIWTIGKADLKGPVHLDYGTEIGAYLKNPVSICAAEGSAVRVFQGNRLQS